MSIAVFLGIIWFIVVAFIFYKGLYKKHEGYFVLSLILLVVFIMAVAVKVSLGLAN